MTAAQRSLVNRKRKCIDVIGISVGAGLGASRWLRPCGCARRCLRRRRRGFLSGEELVVCPQVSSRHRASYRLSCGETITKKARAAIRLHLWLILHVLPARGGSEN